MVAGRLIQKGQILALAHSGARLESIASGALDLGMEGQEPFFSADDALYMRSYPVLGGLFDVRAYSLASGRLTLGNVISILRIGNDSPAFLTADEQFFVSGGESFAAGRGLLTYASSLTRDGFVGANESVVATYRVQGNHVLARISGASGGTFSTYRLNAAGSFVRVSEPISSGWNPVSSAKSHGPNSGPTRRRRHDQEHLGG